MTFCIISREDIAAFFEGFIVTICHLFIVVLRLVWNLVLFTLFVLVSIGTLLVCHVLEASKL